MTTARRDFTIALGITTCVSLAGNVAAATLLPHNLELPTGVVIAAASVAPLLLPGAVHLVPKTHGLPTAARRVVVLAVLVAGIAAFALSFASLQAVAKASGHGGYLAALLPLAVDVLAAAAALALVLLPAEDDAHQSADHDAEHTASRSPDTRDADRTMARHAADDAPASQPLTWDDAVTHPDDAHPVTRTDDAVTRTPDAVHEAGHDVDDADHSAAGHGAVQVDDARRDATRGGDPVHALVTRDADRTTPRRLASVPAASSGRDAEILRRVTAGESSATIASAMGMSKSTALRNIKRVTEANAASSTAAAG